MMLSSVRRAVERVVIRTFFVGHVAIVWEIVTGSLMAWLLNFIFSFVLLELGGWTRRRIIGLNAWSFELACATFINVVIFTVLGVLVVCHGSLHLIINMDPPSLTVWY